MADYSPEILLMRELKKVVPRSRWLSERAFLVNDPRSRNSEWVIDLDALSEVYEVEADRTTALCSCSSCRAFQEKYGKMGRRAFHSRGVGLRHGFIRREWMETFKLSRALSLALEFEANPGTIDRIACGR